MKRSLAGNTQADQRSANGQDAPGISPKEGSFQEVIGGKVEGGIWRNANERGLEAL